MMNLQNENRKLRQTRFILILIVFLLSVVSIVSYDRALKLQTTNIELQQQNEQLISDNSTLQARYSLSQRFLMDARVKLLRDYENASQAIIEEIRATYYIDDIPLTLDEQRYIKKVCDRYGLDYKLFIATIDLESNFNQFAVNHNTNGTTDEGYGQLNDANKKWLEDKLGRELDMFNFKDNIDSMAWIMNYYKDDNYYKSILNYNRGEYGARKYYENYLTYKSDYVKMVLDRKSKYE